MQQNSLWDLLKEADQNGYAINAFNFTDVWDVISIVEAAKELNAPVMIAVHPENFKEVSLGMCAAIGKQVMAEATTPVILHLDHCSSVQICKDAIDCGFPSVMIDASALSLEENIAAVKQVADYAHLRGVHVEAELGRIKGHGYEGGYAGEDYLARVEDCIRLVRETNVDSIAVGIGTAHGFYKGMPEINFERLCEINEAVAIPLVLHGGTGIPAEDVQRSIKFGINKVNVGTCVTSTYMNSIRKELNAYGENAFIIDIIGEVKKEIKAVIKEWICTCMGDNKTKNL